MVILDLFRSTVMCINAFSFIILLRRFHKLRGSWNSKDRDYWYALMIWTFAGFLISFDGILASLQFTSRTVLIAVASMVTLSAILKGGAFSDIKHKSKT